MESYKKTILFITMVIAIAYSCKTHFATTNENYSANKTSTSFERGKNLVFNICAGCHYDHSANKFIGKPIHDFPKIMGPVYSANLTNSAQYGVVSKYSDAELFYLLKTGIAKNGRLKPYMMKPTLADEDINDIIVYLRSGDEPVAAADTSVGKTHLNILGRTVISIFSKPQTYHTGVPRPNENDPVIYGRYLVGVIGCYHCHSKNPLKLSYADPEKSKGYMAGGNKFKDYQGKRIYSPNLTPDKETGIGNFSKEDFRKAVKEGQTPDDKKLRPPMGQFRHLTDKQVEVIYTYLQSLPPKYHKIKGR